MKQTDRRSARRGLATGVESLNFVAFAWACGQFEMRNEECEMEHPAAGQPEGFSPREPTENLGASEAFGGTGAVRSVAVSTSSRP